MDRVRSLASIYREDTVMRLTPHVHDYDMKFPNEESMDYHMECRCGDRCATMDEALRRTWRSMDFRMAYWLSVFVISLLVISGLLIVLGSCR